MARWVDIGNVDDIPEASMIVVEIEGRDIMVTKIDDKIYAVQDRCGHMCASLSSGTLLGKTVVCPLHHSEFDIETGNVIIDAKVTELNSYLRHMGIPPILTKSLKTYNVKVRGSRVWIQV